MIAAQTALLRSIEAGEPELVEAILRQKPKNINHYYLDGNDNNLDTFVKREGTLLSHARRQLLFHNNKEKIMQIINHLFNYEIVTESDCSNALNYCMQYNDSLAFEIVFSNAKVFTKFNKVIESFRKDFDQKKNDLKEETVNFVENILYEYDNSPLLYAIRNLWSKNDSERKQLLEDIQNKLKAEYKAFVSKVETPYWGGNSPLVMAILHKEVELVRALIEEGADTSNIRFDDRVRKVRSLLDLLVYQDYEEDKERTTDLIMILLDKKLFNKPEIITLTERAIKTNNKRLIEYLYKNKHLESQDLEKIDNIPEDYVPSRIKDAVHYIKKIKYDGKNGLLLEKLSELYYNQRAGLEIDKPLQELIQQIKQGKYHDLINVQEVIPYYEFYNVHCNFPLEVAMNIGSYELVEALLFAGAKLNDNSLVGACRKLVFLEILIDKGNATKEQINSCLSKVLEKGTFDSSTEMINNNIKAVNFLLKKGADIKVLKEYLAADTNRYTSEQFIDSLKAIISEFEKNIQKESATLTLAFDSTKTKEQSLEPDDSKGHSRRKSK